MSTNRYRQIVINHLAKVRGELLLAGLCILGTAMMTLVGPWPMKLIFDNVLSDKPMPSLLQPLQRLMALDNGMLLLILCGSMIIIALMKGVFVYLQSILTSRIGYQLVNTLRSELFDHLQRLSLSFHTKERSGQLLCRLTSDTNNLKDVYADSALAFTTHLLTMTGMLIIMLNLNITLCLVVLISLPILFAAIYSIYWRVKLSARNQRHNEGLLSSRVNEILAAVPLIQAYGMEKFEQERFDCDSSRSMRDSIRISRMEAAAARLVEIFSAAGMSVVVFLGCLQVIAGRMTPGDVLVFASYITQIYQPIRQMARLSTRFSRATVSIERITEILNTEPDIKNCPHAIIPNLIKGDIAFQHVTFAYRKNNNILNDVSFRIKAGERVALVGASGAGKSTIANLIIRLYEAQQGKVLIDNIDIKRYQCSAIRREIAVVLQDSILFGSSIKENIAYGRPDATMAEIKTAARQANADDFITALPDGYETLIGERGGRLSGGQRQRICLARAMLRRATILVMDEPTSSVDAQSQALFCETLARLKHDKTILLIAHQFNTILNFDRILVLKNGNIIEQGNHEKLLKLKGYYHRLYCLQNGLKAA